MPSSNPLIPPKIERANPKLERRYSITVTKMKRQRACGTEQGKRLVVPILFRMGFLLEVTF